MPLTQGLKPQGLKQMKLGYFGMPSHPPERSIRDGFEWDLEALTVRVQVSIAEQVSVLIELRKGHSVQLSLTTPDCSKFCLKGTGACFWGSAPLVKTVRAIVNRHWDPRVCDLIVKATN